MTARTRKTISQREARALRRKVAELQAMEKNRRSRWSSEWPGGVNILSIDLNSSAAATLRTALALQHGVAVKMEGDTARFYALRHPELPS